MAGFAIGDHGEGSVVGEMNLDVTGEVERLTKPAQRFVFELHFHQLAFLNHLVKNTRD